MRVTALLLLALGAFAQDYFPLAPGNQWIYRSTTGTVTAEVVRTETFNGRSYALVRGLFGSDVWLRTAEDGSLQAYNPDTGTESLWTAFGAAGEFQSAIPPCPQPAQVASRAAKYSGPIGEFTNALEVRYGPGRCADAGNERDLYLPWVGLVQRTVTTIAGPRTYDLIYARLGVTEISASETGFRIALDRSVYTANLMPPVDPQRSIPRMIARLTLRNTSDPIQLTFPSGQRYDLVIRNEKGEEVYRWSTGIAFTQVFGVETVQGERNWVIEAPLRGADGVLPQGKYVAEAWLTTQGPRTWAASAGFEVRHVF